MDLKEKLESLITEEIKSRVTSQSGPLSGSNALIYDGYNFESEDSDHCPRMALLRRVGDVQETKPLKTFLSNRHGRAVEELVKSLLSRDSEIEFMAEEEVEVKLEDTKNTLLTARPDLIIKYKDEIYPIELKTVQSGSTAFSIFIKEKPKLGALIQLAIYLYGHQKNKGYLLYICSNWFSGYAGKGNRWTVEPSIKVFEVEVKEDGYYYYNNIKSLLNFQKIIQGSYKFLELKEKEILPERPVWLDINGEVPNYKGCTYCFAASACDYMDTMQNTNLMDFFHKAKESL